jgi:hypothetical protein
MKWRAVVFGAVVGAFLLFASLIVPFLGHAAAGAAGGFVAGALGGGGQVRGWEHGAAVGLAVGGLSLLVGVVLAVTVGVDVVTVEPVAAALGPALTAGAGLPTALAGAALVAVCADSAGALGGRLRGTREFPGRLENERR